MTSKRISGFKISSKLKLYSFIVIVNTLIVFFTGIFCDNET